MAAGKIIEIRSDLLLVHEGRSDLHVLRKLRSRLSIEGYQSLPLNGQSNRGRYLKALALSPHFKSPVPDFNHPVRALAVVLDAEGDARSTFAGVRDALLNAGLPAPDAPGGIAEGPLRVGVFLVPDNQSPGMIETLCLRSIEGDSAWQCVGEFFTCVANRGGTLPVNLDKARAQAFLATRPTPNLPVGLAAEEGYWNFEHQAFAPLAEFLRVLAR